MWWLLGKIGIIIAQLERLIDTVGKLAVQIQDNSAQLRTINAQDRQILSQLGKVIDIFTPKPTYTVITIGASGGTMPLQVGQKSTATVTVLDQFGQPMTSFDFAANAPAWTLSDPNAASLAPGSTPDTEEVTGLAVGSEILSVNVPGVTNPTASLSFSVAAAAPVATSVEITTSPDITG
jgi:hypothetical protein